MRNTPTIRVPFENEKHAISRGRPLPHNDFKLIFKFKLPCSLLTEPIESYPFDRREISDTDKYLECSQLLIIIVHIV